MPTDARINNLEKEWETLTALLELVKQGDMSVADAVKYFRSEFNCSLTYVLHIGFYKALLEVQQK